MNNKTHINRSGLSIIEVLTSIVVALIGVFGVMALIPFSIKQSQSGLDRDAATMIARNALAKFEAEGYKLATDNPVTGAKQLNWVDMAGTRYATNNLVPVCIDPLGVTERGFSTFPFNVQVAASSPALNPNDLLAIPSVNLLRPNGAPFSIADARRMFRITDDLVFGDPLVSTLSPDEELNGPAQIFNSGALGTLNRQSVGSISWCALAQPNVNSVGTTEVDSYKLYILVFKDRVTDVTVEESRMNSAFVTPPANPNAAPLSTIEIDQPPDENLRRDDWVMLINRSAPTAQTNIAFARITNISAIGTNGARLTLDGPDFNFVNDTRVVHLRDVVSVYARTIKLETTSSWNISL